MLNSVSADKFDYNKYLTLFNQCQNEKVQVEETKVSRNQILTQEDQQLSMFDQIIKDHIFWTHKEDYLIILKEYIDQVSDVVELEFKFYNLRNQNLEEATNLFRSPEKVKGIEFTSAADNFFRIIQKLYYFLNGFYNDDSDSSFEEFDNEIEEIYNFLQKNY